MRTQVRVLPRRFSSFVLLPRRPQLCAASRETLNGASDDAAAQHLLFDLVSSFETATRLEEMTANS